MHYQFKFIFFLISFFLYKNTQAAKVDTVETFSPSMNKVIKAVVVTPEGYKKSKKPFPVVYLLHGWSGGYTSYPRDFPVIKKYADEFKMILVSADGNYNSWYFDSPVDEKLKYETYISKELVDWVDSRYKTIKNRTGRGITGLSMGGHGAFYLSFKHQDVFGVAGSMSGGLDFRPFPTKWGISQKLGSLETHPENWEKYTVINMIDLLKPGSLALIIDCGIDDFFFTVNNSFHQKLLTNKIPHDYIVRPGAHNRDYWTNAIGYQLFFMHNYFARAVTN